MTFCFTTPPEIKEFLDPVDDDDDAELEEIDDDEKIVVTFGTFDLFHIGHLNILKRASKFGSKLYVGVSTDRLNYEKKKRFPVFKQEIRMEIIKNIKCVSGVFEEDKLELKKKYLKNFNADVLVMGNDWEGKFDYLEDQLNIPMKKKKKNKNFEVVYLPRTDGISTTCLINKIKRDLEKEDENDLILREEREK